jgi:hypothetical protein
MNARINTIALLLLALVTTSADAQGKGRGKSDNAQVSRGAAKGPGTDVEIRIIREYYSGQSRKPKSLPPGIAKNLVRGKPLPPGIARTRAPDDLIVLLPVRSGTHWIVAGDVVLLVDAGDIIVDLVRLIF